MPFWQYFRKGWNGCALLVQPSKSNHSNCKKYFCFRCRWIYKILESAYSFILKYSKIIVWEHLSLAKLLKGFTLILLCLILLHLSWPKHASIALTVLEKQNIAGKTFFFNEHSTHQSLRIRLDTNMHSIYILQHDLSYSLALLYLIPSCLDWT